MVEILQRTVLFFKANPTGKTKYTQWHREDKHIKFQYKKERKAKQQKTRAWQREKMTKKNIHKQVHVTFCESPELLNEREKLMNHVQHHI